jgi:hypothetical protein
MSDVVRILLSASFAIGLGATGLGARAQGHSPLLVKPRQFVTQYGCAQAQGIASDPVKVSALGTADRDEVEIVAAQCSAEAHNQQHPGQPSEAVLITPDPSQADPANKLYVKAVSVADARAVREYCEKVAVMDFIYLTTAAAAHPPASSAAGPADVEADPGRPDCDSFVKAAKPNNTLIVLTPAIVGGTAASVRLLTAIGADQPADVVKAEADRLALAVQGDAVKGAQGALDHPTILADASVVGAQSGAPVVGRARQILHAGSCVLTMGFACPNGH